MYLTREQLIDAARTAAKYLPVASAQLMNELANRLDITSVTLCEAMAQRKELAKQNATLREDVSKNAAQRHQLMCIHLKRSANYVNYRLLSFLRKTRCRSDG
jgi:hypothetical protein